MDTITSTPRPGMPHTHSKVLKWSLIIGIMIVLNLFFNYALSLVYSAPDYQKFCPQSQVVETPQTKTQCLAVGGQWVENTNPSLTSGPDKPLPAEKISYCNPEFTCQKNYQTSADAYERNVFITLVVLGFLSIGAGLFLRGNDTISSALSLGGVLSFFIASVRYWSSAENLIKVVILAVALLGLFWLAYKKFQNR
jgi:hypothetical protein